MNKTYSTCRYLMENCIISTHKKFPFIAEKNCLTVWTSDF